MLLQVLNPLYRKNQKFLIILNRKKIIFFKLKKQKNLIILNRKIKIRKLYNNIEQKNKNRKKLKL